MVDVVGMDTQQTLHRSLARVHRVVSEDSFITRAHVQEFGGVQSAKDEGNVDTVGQLAQQRITFAQCIHDGDVFGDIANRRGDNGCTVDVEATEPDINRDLGLVLPLRVQLAPDVQLMPAWLCRAGTPQRRMERAVRGRQQDLDVSTDHLVAAVSEQLGRRVVHKPDHAVGVDDHTGVLSSVQHSLKKAATRDDCVGPYKASGYRFTGPRRLFFTVIPSRCHLMRLPPASWDDPRSARHPP